jgi:hypothetical protein
MDLGHVLILKWQQLFVVFNTAYKATSATHLSALVVLE